MAKYHGTLTANVNTVVEPSDLSRQTICIHNKDNSNPLYVEFDAAASVDTGFVVQGKGTLILSVRDWPLIRGEVNLISGHAVAYTVRTV